MPANLITAVLAYAVLCAVHGLPWLARTSPPLLQNPAKMAAGLSALHVLPHYLIVMIWPEKSLLFSYMGGDLTPLLGPFALLYSVGMLALLFGIRVGKGYLGGLPPIVITRSPNYYLASMLAFGLYLLSMIFIIQQNGGIGNYLSVAGTQAEFQGGLGVISIIKVPASYLAILFLTVQYARTGRPHLVWILALILIIASVEATLGSRRAPIQLLLFGVASIYMLKGDQKLFTALNVFVAFICGLIFVLLLSLRGDSGEERDVLDYVANFSYNDIYMFVMDHFQKNDLWYGKVFLDFQYRFTGGIDGWPPPSLDEGLYIYNLFLGYQVEPPLPADMMALNSWPPRTFGNGFMNFGWPGVVIFSFIQGWLTGKAFRLVLRSSGHPIFLFLFLLLVFSFQVSNLKLTELMAAAVGLVFIFGPMYLLERGPSRLAKS